MTKSLLRLNKKNKYILSALWFGVFGTIASSLLYLIPAVSRGGFAVALFVILPGLSSCFSGVIYGVKILEKRMTTNIIQAILRGIFTSILAFLIFAPMFSILYSIIEDNSVNILGLTASIYMIGGIATAPVILTTGAISGAALFILRDYLYE